MATDAPTIIVNREFKRLCPPLSADELAQLESNLATDGCRDPLVVWAGHDILLDGHNRHEICTRRGIEFGVVEVECADRDAAKVWIIRNQFGKRNLTLAARCKLAEELEAVYAGMAKANMAAGGKLGGESKAKGSAILPNPIDSRERAAKEAGVSPRTLTAYKAVKAGATPATMAALLTDPNVKLHRVAKEVREKKKGDERAKKIKAAKASIATSTDDRGVKVGSFV